MTIGYHCIFIYFLLWNVNPHIKMQFELHGSISGEPIFSPYLVR